MIPKLNTYQGVVIILGPMNRERTPRKGDIVELNVEALAFGGMGVARIEDFVVFTRGTVPGDLVRARVTKRKKSYAEARVEELVSPSPNRRPARCSSFGLCGGCTWQCLDYEMQLDYKARQVRDSLERLGKLTEFDMLPIVGMTDPWRYRNRADFSIGSSAEGAVVGFRPPGRWDSVLPIPECHLLDPPIEKLRGTVEEWLRDNEIPGWSPRAGTGYARHLLVRSASGGSEVLVSLVTAPGALPDAPGLIAGVRTAHPEVAGILHATNSGRAEISSGLKPRTLWGRSHLFETVAGLDLKISLNAFFQTNTAMACELYRLVAAEAGTGPEKPDESVVWDLYSGVGSIGLSLAGRMGATLGIEAVHAAVRDARENARRNAAVNAHFLEGDVARVLREVADGVRRLPEGLERPNVIIVDPPRAGLSKKAVCRIGEVAAPRIVYVSCNPATMAPNVAQFQDYGYRLRRVTPVDMFPHTPHVEVVGLLIHEPTLG